MSINFRPYLEVYRSRRVGMMLIFGFSSGLPLALTGGTLQAWMTVVGVDLRTIGLFSLVGLPYTLNSFGLHLWIAMCRHGSAGAEVG